MALRSKHLLGIEPLSAEEILLILDTAESFREISTRPIKKVPTLRGKTIINFFLEPSTRTRTSFEIAAKRLSADTINISASGSSLVKGETLIDTAKNLEAMNPDLIVLRHSQSGAPHVLAQYTRASIINGGDGCHEHPTQALLDALTIRQEKCASQKSSAKKRAKSKSTGEQKIFNHLKVAMIGDITHSRVARSNVHLLTKLGAQVTVCGPPTLIPPEFDRLAENLAVTLNMDEAMEGADVVMMLRVQLERQQEVFFPSVKEYFHYYGLDEKRMKRAKPDAIVMHPGPMNRGVEIASEVADGPYSVILDQVTNGVAVRMALMFLLLGGSGEAVAH